MANIRTLMVHRVENGFLLEEWPQRPDQFPRRWVATSYEQLSEVVVDVPWDLVDELQVVDTRRPPKK